jgi:DNA-directed RNA polymerase subunit E'/Rpb7
MSDIQQEIPQTEKAPGITTIVAPKKKKDVGGLGLYMKNIISKRVVVPFISVGLNIREILEKKLISSLEGRCIEEGFVQKKSVRVVNYSSGIIQGNNVVFDVVLECLICNPAEGHRFKAKVVNVTKAGLRCEANVVDSPVDVFVARDHHYNNAYFNGLQKDDSIEIRVLAQRFELNDSRISVIAEVIIPKTKAKKEKKDELEKPKKTRSKKPILILE